jgi:hypothetical protein
MRQPTGWRLSESGQAIEKVDATTDLKTRRRHAGYPQLEVERPQMNAQKLINSVRTLVAGDKSLLGWKGHEHDDRYLAAHET